MKKLINFIFSLKMRIFLKFMTECGKNHKNLLKQGKNPQK